jgi:hypothetical protein
MKTNAMKSSNQNPSAYIGEADFQTRFDAQEKLAAMVGIRLPKTIVPPGEGLWDIGEQAKQKLEHEIDALPSFALGAKILRDRIAAEDARDYEKTPIQRISMRVIDERPMLSFADATVGYTKTGLNHVIDAVKPAGLQGLTSNLLAISDPALRAEVFNHHAKKAHERAKEPVTLRTIVEPSSGVRVLRAVTSGIHSGATGDDLAVLDAIDDQLSSSLAAAKMRGTRDLQRSYMEVLWPAMKRQTKVGDIVLIGVRVRNSETKQGGLRVEPFVLDTLCYNFTTAESTGGAEEVAAGFGSIRHVGDLGKKLADVFMRCLKKVDPFIHAFADAYKAPLGDAPRGELLQRVQRVFALPDETIKLAADVWDSQAVLHKSPGDSLADLVNALTKASQEQSMDDAMETGRAAGTLIERGLSALEEKPAKKAKPAA